MELPQQVRSQVSTWERGGRQPSNLDFRLRLREVHHAAALFPYAALFEQVDALETLEDVALGCNGTGGTEAAML